MSTTDFPDIRLDQEQIQAALGAGASRFAIDVRASCTSSNTLLYERAQEGAASGSVLVCEEQTAGRGRRGRAWIAPPGGSLAFSLLWRFMPAAAGPAGLSLAVGVALANALGSLGAKSLELKWPNDVLHSGRKLAGILIELVPGAGEGTVAVIGVGLNVRLPQDFEREAGFEATDLAAAIPTPPSRSVALVRLLEELDVTLTRFEHQGFAGIRDAWLARQAYRGRQVRVTLGEKTLIEGQSVGVDHDGALLVLTADGVERVLAGDVSLRPA